MADVRFLWDLYWPAVAVALAVGIGGGLYFFRPRRSEKLGIAVLVLAVVGVAALWHGPLGASDRFRSEVEQVARTTLDYYELPQVQARLERGPLTRRLLLSGPADDFQRRELVRIMAEVPGAGSARWTNGAAVGFVLPLLAIAELMALAGFGLGLVISYLLELRRRARAEWRW
jgi:hypothetical protein